VVLGVFHKYRQELHADVKRKSQPLPGRVSQELPLGAAQALIFLKQTVLD